MSSEDQVRPYHAKKAPGQEAADAVAAVMQHASERDEAQQKKQGPKKQPKWMLPLGMNLGVFAVYLLIAPPAWVVLDPIEPQPIAEQAADMRMAMWMQANRVLSYVNANGQLPTALEDAGSTYPGIDYNVTGPNQWSLSATVGEETIVYNSSQPLTEWAPPDLTNRLLGGA